MARSPSARIEASMVRSLAFGSHRASMVRSLAFGSHRASSDREQSRIHRRNQFPASWAAPRSRRRVASDPVCKRGPPPTAGLASPRADGCHAPTRAQKAEKALTVRPADGGGRGAAHDDDFAETPRSATAWGRWRARCEGLAGGLDARGRWRLDASRRRASAPTGGSMRAEGERAHPSPRATSSRWSGARRSRTDCFGCSSWSARS
jgi:hypothetical protein